MSFLPLRKHNSVVAQHYMKQVKPGTLAYVERVDERPPTARIFNDGADGKLYAISYSSDGTQIRSATSKGLFVWDVESGIPFVGLFPNQWEEIQSVKFSANGERLASRNRNNKIIVWDAVSGEVIQDRFEGLSGKVYSVAIHPGGEYVAASLDTRTRVWKVKDGRLSTELESED